MSGNNEKAKLRYEAPTVMRLGELARGQTECGTGSAATGNCNPIGNAATNTCNNSGNSSEHTCSACGNYAGHNCGSGGNFDGGPPCD